MNVAPHSFYRPAKSRTPLAAARKPVEKSYGAKATYTETAYERRRREAREARS